MWVEQSASFHIIVQKLLARTLLRLRLYLREIDDGEFRQKNLSDLSKVEVLWMYMLFTSALELLLIA